MKIILLLFLFFTVTLTADTQDRAIQRMKIMKEEQRVALVIGNNDYKSLSKLQNPINDARLIKSVLKERGFEILYKENATKREMKKLLKDFSYKLRSGGVGLYYFAGHGIDVGGRNYLIGTDSVVEDKDEVEYETIHNKKDEECWK